MANANAAFGLLPIGKVGQNRDAQGQSEYSIAANASAIYFQDPVKAIQSAIRSGKNRAAQITSLLLTQIGTKLRAVIDAIVTSLGLDASGQLSKTYIVAKDIFRQINYCLSGIHLLIQSN